jgi:uncharacterized membrane protein YdjX (TVP38/TMEM64 family)
MVTESHVNYSPSSKYGGIILAVLVGPIIAYLLFKNKRSKDYLLSCMKYIKDKSHRGIQGRIMFVFFVIFMNLVLQDSTIPNILSGQLFGFKEGVLWTSVGCSLSGVISFYLARYRFRDTVESLIDEEDHLKAMKDSESDFETRDWLELIALSRVPPIYPYHFISYFWGTTEADVFTYMIGSYVGVFPSICLETYVGCSLSDINEIYHLKTKGKKIILIIAVSIMVTVAIGFKAESIIKSHDKVAFVKTSPAPGMEPE